MKMKKMISVTMALAMTISLLACNVCLLGAGNTTSDAKGSDESAGKQSAEINAKEMTWYMCDMKDTCKHAVYFAGDSDVPYVSLEDWAELYPYLLKKYVRA